MDVRTSKMLNTRQNRVSNNPISQVVGLPNVKGRPSSASIVSREYVVAGHIKDVSAVDGEDLVIIGPAGSSVPSLYLSCGQIVPPINLYCSALALCLISALIVPTATT